MEAKRPDNVVYPRWGVRKSATAREAILDAFEADQEFAMRFATACRKGAVEVRNMILDVRSALLVRGHRFATHENQFEEVGEALFDLASELLPGSPGAVRQKLREKVEARGNQKDADPVEAIEALAAEEYAAFDYLVLAASRDTDEAFLNAAKHIWGMLQERGRKYKPERFSQYVRTVLEEVFEVEKSAELEVAEVVEGEMVDEGDWDADRAHEITQQALQYIADHTQDIDCDAVDRTEPDRIKEEMWVAAEVGDLERYIEAAREWARAWRRAAERARGRG